MVLRALAILASALALAGCGGTSGSSTSIAQSVAENPPASPVTTSSDTVHLSASSYSIAQSAGSVTITVSRTTTAATPITIDYDTADGTAVAGSDYTGTSGTLQWAENNAADKSITIPISTAAAFSGSKSFDIVLSNPSANASLGSPGSASVAISGAASAGVGTLDLADSALTVQQSAKTVTVSVNRSGGDVGATTVAYATTNGTAVAGTDYTKTAGVLAWADGDSAAKSFSVPISNATPFSGDKTFQVGLSNATSGAMIGNSDTTVTIVGSSSSAVGTLQLSAANYSAAQSSGSLKITVNRTGGSNGAASVAYSTKNGTAVAGTDFTAASGTLKWTDGDTAAKTFSVAISNTTPFSGSRTFSVSLSSPSAGATVSSPSTATVAISGSAASPSAGSTFWVYYNGIFNWGGDYSFVATANYKDTSGVPLSGAYDIAVTVTGAYGGFLPYAGGIVPLWNFDSSPYSYLTFAFKPTVANQAAQVFFVKVGDIPVGVVVDPFNGQYGPKPQVGVWGTYRIPLSDLGVKGTSIYKFAIQDQTGLSHNVFYVDNIGFN
jgi:hypothetical protein